MSHDPLLEYMRKKNIPLTRQNYLNLNFMGKVPAKLDPEVEASLPKQLQMPVEEETEMPQAPTVKTGAKKQGPEKPKKLPDMQDIYIGVKQLANSKNIKPLLDTENPPVQPMPGGAKMDTSNPASPEILPKEPREQ